MTVKEQNGLKAPMAVVIAMPRIPPRPLAKLRLATTSMDSR